jgi:hypothetical protein
LNTTTTLYGISSLNKQDDIFAGVSDDEERMNLLSEAGYFKQSVIEPQNKEASFSWSIDDQQWYYVYADNPSKIIVVLDSDNLDVTTQQVMGSFNMFIEDWLSNNEAMPVRNGNNGSMSWKDANNTGEWKDTKLKAQFWNEYFEYADSDGLNANNSEISDFLVFFEKDDEGNYTSDISGVYIQMGGKRSIYFANGSVVNQQHYSSYIDSDTKQLIQPNND